MPPVCWDWTRPPDGIFHASHPGHDAAARYRIITSCAVPRPIAWVTTLGENGLVNIAPFSSYNYIAHSPPMVGINIGLRDGKLKDTARNLEATKEFVISMPTVETMEAMNMTSANMRPMSAKRERHGIPLIPSQFIKPPRIANTPVQMECRLTQVLPLGTGHNIFYIGEVVAFHLDNEIFDGRHVDIAKMNPIARLAGPYYAKLGEIVRMERPMTSPDSVMAKWSS